MAVHVDADQDVILKPIKYHPIQKLIVYVPGAFVPDYDYTTLSQAIQQACPYQLWVGIPTFTGNFPNPLQLSTKIKGIISVVQQAGFSALNTSSDVYVAGHSVGGTFAQDVVVSDSYGALILFGSYLLVKSNVPNHLSSYPVPVLTLGAELDGLTRMTRIAVEYTNYKEVVKSISEQQAILTKPVVILRQITHSQFCAGVNVSGDIVPPEISYQQAHQTIAAVTSAFLENINNATTSSFNLMRTWISENDALLQSWYQASAIEQDPTWCAQKQLEICNVKPTPSLNVVNNVTKDMLTLEFDHPTIEANTQGGANIVTASFVSYESNLFDVSTMIMAAKQVYCKMKSDEAIADTLNMTIPTQTISCAQLNQATLEQALSLVSSEAKARYYRRGAQLSMIADVVETTGFGWTLANINFNLTSPGMYTVQSPSLVSPQNTPFGLGGMHYCTLVSVARAVEWILVDSMKPNPSM